MIEMTGPAEGKILLENAEILLLTNLGSIKLDGEVYIHIKGYALAKVTHLDIEHDILDNIIPPKRGKFLTVRKIKDGIRIDLDRGKEIQLKNKNVIVYAIKIAHPILTEVLEGRVRTWIGGKFGGIYIGFRKEQIGKLEKIAREKFNFPI